MLGFELNDKFAKYLRESLSENLGGKIKTVAEGVSNLGLEGYLATSLLGKKPQKDLDAKELVYTQNQILKLSEQYITKKPWISYFAALKHFLLLKSKGVTTGFFSDFKDKEILDEINSYSEKIANKSAEFLDNETENYLQELLTLQQAEPLVTQCIAGLEFVKIIPEKERRLILHPEENTRSLLKNILMPNASYEIGKLIMPTARYALARAASLLSADIDEWMMNPPEAVEYLKTLKDRRLVLEETYFSDISL